MQVCLERAEPAVDSAAAPVSKKAICQLALDPGLASCSDQLRRWHYSSQQDTCTAFIYSGCAGNQNRSG